MRITDHEMSERKQGEGCVHTKGQPGLGVWSLSKTEGASVWEGGLEWGSWLREAEKGIHAHSVRAHVRYGGLPPAAGTHAQGGGQSGK